MAGTTPKEVTQAAMTEAGELLSCPNPWCQDALTEYLRQAIEGEANRQPATWDWYDLARAAARSLEAASSTPLVGEGLVERVARALCAEDGYDPDDEIIGGQCTGFQNFGPRWQANERSENTLGGRNYVRDARAVIAALQPPAADTRTEHGLAKLVHENGPVVIDFWGEELAWRPLYSGTWTVLRTTGQPATPSQRAS